MAGAGQGGLTEAQKMILRYVLNPGSPKLLKPDGKFNLDALPWITAASQFVVYRGQSSSTERHGTIERKGPGPTVIATTLGRPLSTSNELRDHIVTFAVGWDDSGQSPRGRVFKITVQPGVQYVDFYRSLNLKSLKDTDFEFLDEELKEQVKGKTVSKRDYSNLGPPGLRKRFIATIAMERELILRLDTAHFEEPGAKPESWSRDTEDTTYAVYAKMLQFDKDGKPLMDGGKQVEKWEKATDVPIQVYATILVPNRPLEGRGRTFRRKTLRRNKHGSRLARKSKHSFRNRHA